MSVKSNVSSFIFYLDDISIDESEVLKFPTIIVLVSISSFRSPNICFVYLGAPMLSVRLMSTRAHAACQHPAKRQRQGLGYKCVFNMIRCWNLGRSLVKTLTSTFHLILLRVSLYMGVREGNVGKEHKGDPGDFRPRNLNPCGETLVLKNILVFVASSLNRMVRILKPVK